MQTRKASALEALVNVAIGFVASLLVAGAYLRYRHPPSAYELTLLMTGVSLFRQFALRRAFVAFTLRESNVVN